MKAKHTNILKSIFLNPVPTSIKWSDIEKLILALGGDIKQGRGSRVRFLLNGTLAVFHRPHPKIEASQGAIKSVRRFLVNSNYDLKSIKSFAV